MGTLVRMTPKDEALLSKRQLAEVLGFSQSWVSLHMRESGLPYVKIGAGLQAPVRFYLSEVKAWMGRMGSR